MPKKAKTFILPLQMGQQIKYRRKSWIVYFIRFLDINEYIYSLTDGTHEIEIDQDYKIKLELNGKITETNFRLAIQTKNNDIEDDTW